MSKEYADEVEKQMRSLSPEEEAYADKRKEERIKEAFDKYKEDAEKGRWKKITDTIEKDYPTDIAAEAIIRLLDIRKGGK